MRSIAVLCAALCWLNLSGCVVHDHKGPSIKIPVPVASLRTSTEALPTGASKEGQLLDSVQFNLTGLKQTYWTPLWLRKGLCAVH